MTVLIDTIKCHDWPAVLARLATLVGEAAIANEFGAFPLYEAAGCGAPLAVMQALLHAHPAAVSTPNAFGRLPLHWAAYRGERAADVVELLLRAFPEGA